MVSSLPRNLHFQFVSCFTMAHVPVIPAGADIVAAVDPPVPAPVVPPVVIPAPVAPVEAALVEAAPKYTGLYFFASLHVLAIL